MRAKTKIVKISSAIAVLAFCIFGVGVCAGEKNAAASEEISDKIYLKGCVFKIFLMGWTNPRPRADIRPNLKFDFRRNHSAYDKFGPSVPVVPDRFGKREVFGNINLCGNSSLYFQVLRQNEFLPEWQWQSQFFLKKQGGCNIGIGYKRQHFFTKENCGAIFFRLEKKFSF